MKSRLLAFFLVFAIVLGSAGQFVYAEGVSVFNLTVNYLIEGTNTPIAPAYLATLPAGQEYAVSSPEIDMYELVNASESTVSGVLSSDTTRTVYYRYAAQTADYTILYIGRNADGTNVVTLDQITEEAPINTVIQVPEKAFEGYTKEPTDMSLLVTADGKAVKTVYYTKDLAPSIIFNTGGSYVPMITAEPGTDISQQIADLPEPTKQGYIFAGWDQTLPTVMPETDLVVNAVWEPGKSSYTVEYYFENANDDGYTWNKSLNETRSTQTDSEVTATQADINLADETLCTTDEAYAAHKGTPFFGFDYSHCETVAVAADGSSVLKLYYNREIWTIRLMGNLVGTHSYQRDYNTTKTEFESTEKVVWKEFSGKYGSDLPTDFPDYYALSEYTMELKEVAAEKYQRTDLIYAGHLQIDDESYDSGGQLRYTKWCTFNGFFYEDNAAPKSHTLHAYPAISEKTYFFYLTWMGETLNAAVSNSQEETPGDYEQVNYKVAGPVTSQTAGFTAPQISGFTYKNAKVHSTYKSSWKCEALMWMPPVGGFAGDWHGPGCTCGSNYLRIDERDDWDPVFQACTIDDSYLNDSTGGLNKINVAQNTIFYLQRESYTVHFYDGENEIRTVENVYFEQPLNAVPLAEGGTEDLLAYEPENAPENMMFGGWYLSGDDFGTDNKADSSLTMPAGELNLYAYWIPEDCTVTFNSTGGSDVPVQSVPLNQKAVMPQAPTRNGYEFIAWVDENGYRWSFDQEITSDITLYAWWKPISAVPYRILHVMKSDNSVIAEYTDYGTVGDVRMAYALGSDEDYLKDGVYLVPDAPSKSVSLTESGSNEIIFYYELAGLKDYTVSYYAEGTTTSLHPDKTVTNTALSMVTEMAVEIDGYTPLSATQVAVLTEAGENHIIFYYRQGDAPSENVSVTLKAQKLLDGNTPSGTQFQFLLKDESGAILQTKPSVDGEIVFDALSFDSPGEHVYTITEGDVAEKYKKDESVYRVTVKVTQNQDTQALQADVSVEKNGTPYNEALTFLNTTTGPVAPPVQGEDSAPPATSTPQPSAPASVPQTGDESGLTGWVALLIGSAVACGAVSLYGLKRKRKSHTDS